MSIRFATAADAAAIASIYAPFVENSISSFETDAPDETEMRSRIEAGGGLHPWLVHEEDGRLMGYAYATAFRARPAYRFAVETSIYLRGEACGRGIGGTLYPRLLAMLEAQGFTQAIAGISLPNAASVALHERLGFRRAGTYEAVGWKLGGWRDVGLWQRPLAVPGDRPHEPKLLEAAINFLSAKSRTG